MSPLLAFDPGKRTAAWALFHDGLLSGCGLLRWADGQFPAELPRAIVATQAVIELPQVYRGSVNPKHLVEVTVTVGRIAQALGPLGQTELVWPHAWKGNVDPEVMLRRIQSKLDQREQNILQGAQVIDSLRHNVIDACGLGLWKLNRLGGRKIASVKD